MVRVSLSYHPDNDKQKRQEVETLIFNVPGHIEMIRNGLYLILTDRYGDPTAIVKTESRRLNRGIYQVGKSYAVQRKRGVKAEPDIRIVMDMIWKEEAVGFLVISKEAAWAEGGYTPEEYEKVFRDLNPKWDGLLRWAYKFHVITVQT